MRGRAILRVSQCWVMFGVLDAALTFNYSACGLGLLHRCTRVPALRASFPHLPILPGTPAPHKPHPPTPAHFFATRPRHSAATLPACLPANILFRATILLRSSTRCDLLLSPATSLLCRSTRRFPTAPHATPPRLAHMCRLPAASPCYSTYAFFSTRRHRRSAALYAASPPHATYHPSISRKSATGSGR